MMTDKIIVFVTTGSKEEAEKIAENLVADKLVACVNIMVGVQSVFWWQGSVDREAEVLMIAKTRADCFDELAKKVKEIHNYDVPEVIALPIIAGTKDYLNWIEEETKGGHSS